MKNNRVALFNLIKEAVRDVLREERNILLKEAFKELLIEHSDSLPSVRNEPSKIRESQAHRVSTTPNGTTKPLIQQQILERSMEIPPSGVNLGNIADLKSILGDIKNDPIMKLR